jgi:hypothetical protein
MPRTSLPATLVADTTRLDGPEDGDSNDQSRGASPRSRTRRGRRARPGGKVTGRKFQIPDSVFDRLQQWAFKKRSNPSAVVSELLDRHLPHVDVKFLDRPPAEPE